MTCTDYLFLSEKGEGGTLSRSFWGFMASMSCPKRPPSRYPDSLVIWYRLLLVLLVIVNGRRGKSRPRRPWGLNYVLWRPQYQRKHKTEPTTRLDDQKCQKVFIISSILSRWAGIMCPLLENKCRTTNTSRLVAKTWRLTEQTYAQPMWFLNKKIDMPTKPAG